jgi:FkbM family methyltransferase
VLDALSERMETDPRILTRHAARAKIEGFFVDGEWGRFQSTIEDRMILPIYARTGTWARRTNIELIGFFEGRSGTYLDIGANIGLTTVPVAQNPKVRCIAFEPDPTNYRNLQDNICRNVPHGNVTTHEVALFDRQATLQFSLADDGNLGDHRLFRGPSTNRRLIEVKAMPLDSLLDDVASPLAAKIDVQGAEPAVIAGAGRVLAQAELIIMEFSPFLIAQLGSDYRTVMEFLRGFTQIATMPGEHEGPLTYGSAGTACAQLEAFYASAVSNAQLFMDVYARR